MADIKDVAKAAGVSVATVSRVLNGMDCVRETTAERVRNAIELLSYAPNLQGRHLRTMSTRRILIILNSISNQFYSRVVRAIEDRTRARGYTAIICTTRDKPESFSAHIEMLKTRAVDGAVIMFPEIESGELEKLCKDFPAVCCGEPIDESIDVSWAGIDNVRAASDAMSYIRAQGRSRIAIFGAGSYAYSSILRLRACEGACAVFDEGLSFKAGARAASRLIREVEADAVFAFSDAAAIGAIHTMSEAGLKIPQDIAVMGFDNTAISEMMLPALTTVAQPQYEIGVAAAELLFERIEEKPARRIILPHEIIKRDSI